LQLIFLFDHIHGELFSPDSRLGLAELDVLGMFFDDPGLFGYGFRRRQVVDKLNCLDAGLGGRSWRPHEGRAVQFALAAVVPGVGPVVSHVPGVLVAVVD
jgi:hypothetical protein